MKTRRLWLVFLYAGRALGLYYWIWYYRVHAELRAYARTEGRRRRCRALRNRPGALRARDRSIGSWLLVPLFVSQWRFYKRIRLAKELAGVQEHERINHVLGFVLFLLAYFLLAV